MKKMALMKAMSSTESSTMSPSDGGLYKMKQKIKSNQNQRKIKRVMKDQGKSNATEFPSDKTDKIPSQVVVNRNPSGKSSVEEEAKAYAQPVKYKVQQFKKKVKQKMEDVVIEAKKKKMERKNKREGAGGEGGFTVGNCGPGGCKMGEAQPGLGSNWRGKQ